MIEKSAATAPTGNQQVALASSAASVIVRRCYCSRRVAASAEGMAVEKVSRGARNFGGSLLAKCGGFAEASTPSLLKVIPSYGNSVFIPSLWNAGHAEVI